MVRKNPYEDFIWFREDTSGYLPKFLTQVLSQGLIPRHLSCIMDGNRTYSKLNGMDRHKGHEEGTDVLVNVMNWCLKFGIEELSVYAFSIENFKRDAVEVANLFNLFDHMFRNLLMNVDQFTTHGVCLRFIGNWDQIPASIRPLFAKIMTETRHNTKLQLNIAMVYTGRNEITRGVQELWKAINDEQLRVADLSVPLLDKVISISSAQLPVDLLVRTSGVTRLSDYMMWQSTEALMRFVPIMWPEFNLWEFHKAIFFYQRQKMLMRRLRLPKKQTLDLDLVPDNVKKFLVNLEDSYWKMIEEYADEFRVDADDSSYTDTDCD